MVWVWQVNPSIGIFYIKLLQVLFSQLKFTILNILQGHRVSTSQIIIRVSLCHKILEGTLLFLGLIIARMTVIACSQILVLHLLYRAFFRAIIYALTASISFLKSIKRLNEITSRESFIIFVWYCSRVIWSDRTKLAIYSSSYCFL